MELIDKSALVAEINKRIIDAPVNNIGHQRVWAYNDVKDIIGTLEVKEVDTWHLQEKEDVCDVVKDWGLYAIACIMKDGTIQRFNGCLDEDCEGHVHAHIDAVNDDYDNVDEIVKWTVITCINKK